MWRCWVLFMVVGCTKPNPAVCCLDPDDCASIGVSDPERTCADGLACVNNACVVPSCSTDGCSAAAPVCDITLDVCTGCTGSADCDQFETKVCDTESGACVGCVADQDCDASAPVCDANACRACKLDSECPSGACGDDGACVAEADIVYVSPTGTDSGSCPRTSPCFKLQFAVSKTTTTRTHIVMAAGTYTYSQSFPVLITSSAATSATAVHVHGGGAQVILGGLTDGTAMFSFMLPTSLVDMSLEYENGRVVDADAPTTLRRLVITAQTAVESTSTVNAEQISATSSLAAFKVLAGSLVLKKSTLQGGTNGLVATGGTTVELENVLVSDTTQTGIKFEPAFETSGSLSFVTIARTGASVVSGGAGLECPNSGTTVRSTIVWTPTSTKPALTGCSVSSTIAGPVGAVGALNMDPQFVDLNNGDYHLSDISPAKDMAELGPAEDFEGDARPQGDGFDIGADEAL